MERKGNSKLFYKQKAGQGDVADMKWVYGMEVRALVSDPGALVGGVMRPCQLSVGPAFPA